MKFLFLSSFAHLALDPSADRVSGGAELQVALLARELAGRGFETVIVGGDIGQADQTVLQGVRTRTGGRFHTGSLWDSLTSLPRLMVLFAQEKPTHVLLLGWTSWLFILHVLKPLYGYKLVFICGLDTEVNGEFRRENPLRGSLFEYGMRHCDVRFAMTRLQESLFHEHGMDCFLYRNLVLPRHSPRNSEKTIDFLWVARCQPIKQPHIFLDLAESLPSASFEMICPREDAALWETVQQRALSLPNVRFYNGVAYHQVQSHYDAARIFVNTSTFEGWPNSFIQSGLGHTGILSLRVRPDTLFDDYRLGACADGDEARFQTLARQFIAQPAVIDEMGREAARFVADLHDNARETDAFLKGLSSTP